MSKFYCAFGLHRSKKNKCLDFYLPLIENNEELYFFLKERFSLDFTSFFLFEKTVLDEIFHFIKDKFLDEQGVEKFKYLLQAQIDEEAYANCRYGIFIFDSEKDRSIQSVEEAYFKLQALSQRHFLPHTICLDGLFNRLPNLAWTNYGPILLEDLDEFRVLKFFNQFPLVVSHIDKFPYLVNYCNPEQVRIADGSKVRLGAYLGLGTTVMPAGYVNFNSGTVGNAMVEGRISAGVVVGEKSDIGGGASIMGTLSGGNKDIISIGEKCLLGANAGAGISLGDGTTIAAGLYVYAGMKISLYDNQGNPIDLQGNLVAEGNNIFKAKELSGKSNLLFIQDSQTGKVIARPNNNSVELNEQLHDN